MDIQVVLTYVALALALVFLYKKFFGTKKKGKKDCGDDCDCH